MTKQWVQRAISLLATSLEPLPQELNELDWKEALSPDSKKLSKHVSAFANNPGGGFLVFGIEDKTGKLMGLKLDEATEIIRKLGNVCRDAVMPPITMDHSVQNYNGAPLLFVYIKESAAKPVCLKGGSIEEAYIRSGGTTRQASRNELGGLMLNSKLPKFEELHASVLKTMPEVLDLLDYRSISKMLNKPIPQNNSEIIDWLCDEKMIERVNGIGFYITNFGALSAAYNLSDFDGLDRKALRIVKYKGFNKLNAEKEYPETKGYAISFESTIQLLNALLPSSELLKSVFRIETTVYPEIVLRELLANALIHQDFTQRGAGPMVEIFDDRIEISNPGKLLPSKKIDRLIGATPESRNEILAKAFRRYRLSEERGSGFQKAVAAIELYGLPPLKMQEHENTFRVTIYSPKTFAEMTQIERIEACYQHCVIKYLSSDGMTNASLRERFKMDEKQRTKVSKVIKDALAQNKIKPKDANNTSTRFIEYIPYWG